MTWWTTWAIGCSAPSDPRLVAAARLFSKDERDALHAQFQDALSRCRETNTTRVKAVQHHGHCSGVPAARTLQPAQFLQQVCGLPPLYPPLGDALIRVMTKGHSGVTEDDAVLAKARCDLMGEEEAYKFCFSLLLQDPADTSVSQERLQDIVLGCTILALGLPAAAAEDLSPSATAPVHDLQLPQVAAGASSMGGQAMQTDVSQDLPGSISSPGAERTYGSRVSSSNGGVAAAEAMHMEAVVAAITAGALRCEKSAGSEGRLKLAGYREWSKACPAIHQVLLSLLRNVSVPSRVVPASHSAAGSVEAAIAAAMPLPRLVPPPSLQYSLLHPAWAWVLSSCLPPDLRREWHLLFNSARDGKSFTTLHSRLTAAAAQEHQPPTLILVHGKGGHLMGGYAPRPWLKSGSFFGDSTAFIFSLLPALQIFHATGANEKYQYLGVNNSQLPNGIGFGGAAADTALGQFALFVDSTLDTGMSRPMATYGNSSLSSTQVFEVDVVECWSLLPGPHSEGAARTCAMNGSASVLDAREQDRNFMSLAGITTQSDGVRQHADGRPEDDL